MKLAMTTPDGIAHCLLCSWQQYIARKRKNRRTKEEVEVSPQERSEALEKAVLAHLRDCHDRVMLTREEVVSKNQEEAPLPKVYYHGRRPARSF